MTSMETTNWLRTFYSRPGNSDEVEGDDLGTAFELCGAVILASVLTATRSPERLAELTGLPAAFTAVVIANMDFSDFWNCDNFYHLCRTLRTHMDDQEDVVDAIHSLLEDFWSHSKLPGATEILPALRGTSLLFGKPQSWIHQEFLEELIGAELVYDKKLNLQ